ncbi:helix-turn-helix domain-containing protein [Actinomadura litoris]|uniref:helix-turn-helix domain-containing protein n=1 Tax=Actinomadura litoris TaxID=2678616 RepID=UPI001FA6EEAD|nr:helix-turn-helix domain-containing protein [Actinomadura litoris]
MSSAKVHALPVGLNERLLTVAEAAEYLNTSPRFPRRLVAERRIRFVKLGRFVRIPESALREFVSAGLVEPMTASDVWRAV